MLCVLFPNGNPKGMSRAADALSSDGGRYFTPELPCIVMNGRYAGSIDSVHDRWKYNTLNPYMWLHNNKLTRQMQGIGGASLSASLC